MFLEIAKIVSHDYPEKSISLPGMIVLDSGLCNRALLSAELLDLPIYKGDTISIRLFNLLNRFSLSSDYIDDVHIEYNKGL